MKIELLVVGKTAQPWIQQGLAQYEGRIKRYLPFHIGTIPELKNTRNMPPEEQKRKEGEAILKLLRPDDYVVLLDEKGKQMASSAFAGYLNNKMNTLPGRLVFVIGGPYGFSPDVYNAAREQIALSAMTFSHQLVRLVFAEQLYRAFTILANEPYHHA